MRTVGTVPVPTELPEHLRRAHDRLHRRHAGPLDLDDLARTAGVSRHHLVRSHAEVHGRPPGRDLTPGASSAQDLLRATTLSVTEVCHLVGYSGLGSFSATFRAAVGETPSAYQARWGGEAPHVPACWLFMRGLVPPGQPGDPGEAPDDGTPLASGP